MVRYPCPPVHAMLLGAKYEGKSNVACRDMIMIYILMRPVAKGKTGFPLVTWERKDEEPVF